MVGGVFVFKDDNSLVEMQSAQFVSEDTFQDLLARFPALLSGDWIDQTNPRRWILVQREKGVPDQDGGSSRWAIDHLFLDQDGIPTLVEVKRQTDSRLRREVVGQMLDYAANGVVYWSIEELRSQFEIQCERDKRDPERVLADLIGPECATDQYWQKVKTNLQAGRLRMLFVADFIPPELRRVVEFLNGQMDPAEVLALELRQFEGQGLRTLVPKMFGVTEESEAKKTPSGGRFKRSWDETQIFAELERTRPTDEVAAARTIAKWAHDSADAIKYGSGAAGSLSAIYDRAGGRMNLFSLYTDGKIMINFGYSMKPPFDQLPMRQELLRRINETGGVKIAAGQEVDSYPQIRLSDLVGEGRVQTLLSAFQWFGAQLPY